MNLLTKLCQTKHYVNKKKKQKQIGDKVRQNFDTTKYLFLLQNLVLQIVVSNYKT